MKRKRNGAGVFVAALSLLAAGMSPADAAGADDPPPAVTWSREVAPIMQANCQECHRPGQVAPMSLLSFADARPWAKSIREAVAGRTMPPWHADEPRGKFTNDISLTDEQIATILAWVDGGAPEGVPAHLPAPVRWPDSGWVKGEPDLALFPDAPFVVPVTGYDEDLYQCLVIPSGLEEDTWIRGIEYKPGNSKIVHHIIAFADNRGVAPELDAKTPETPGFPCGMGRDGSESLQRAVGIDSMLGGWAPGTPPIFYQDGVGKLLAKGSNIILQMHYFNQTESGQTDLSGIGFHFADSTIQRRMRAMPVIPPLGDFRIPAGEAAAEHRGEWKIRKGVIIYSLAPHMHYLGRDMTFIADYPDGTSETLLTVPRFDFNWQKPYVFAEPRLLPDGSVLRTISHHDNRDENPANPSHPPVDVGWGESTTEEMSIGWVGYSLTDENLDIAPRGKTRHRNGTNE